MDQHLYRIYETIPSGAFYCERTKVGEHNWKRCQNWHGDRTPTFNAALSGDMPFQCRTLEEAKTFVASAKAYAIEDAKPKFRLVCEL